MATSRSPSPAPTAPRLSAPGPRATALTTLYRDACAHVLKTCSYNNFSACFPTPSRQIPAAMKGLHSDFIAKLGDSLRVQFEGILEDRNVIPALNELDALVEEARRRKAKAEQEGGSEVERIVPPHTLPAQQLYLAHLAPSLLQHSRDLRARQETTQAENTELLTRVLQQRKDIAWLVQGLENVVADLDASVAAMNPAGIDELRDEVREVHEEMRLVV